MRNSYLESYYNIIPKIQQDRLLEILKKQYDEAGSTPDDTTLKTQLECLIAELKKPLGIPLVQYRKVKKYSKVSSRDYNNTMEEVYVDLGALFKQNNTVNRVIKNHKLLNDAVLRDVRAAMRKVENDVTVYKVVKENKTGITDAKYNTFYKDDNQSETTVYKAWVDSDTNSLKLPAGMDHSALSINGLAMANIELKHFGGGIKGTLETEDHRREKAIDESLQTFWGEVILTDEPIRQTYDGETKFGAICEITIKLFRAELINHIKFLPFTNYPLNVFKIEYRSESSAPWIDLDITEQFSVSAMEFNFTEVLAKNIKIVINQKNPSINTYKIPKRIINNAQLWQQIVDREYSISTETDNPIQATQDMIDYISGWQAYVDATEKYKERIEDLGKPEGPEDPTISETIFDASTDQVTQAEEKGADELKLDLYKKKARKEEGLVEVRKYEYVYGAYNIDIKKLWYLEKGEYISPKYLANGVIIETRIDTTETVPSGTTIEYQVSTRDNQWKNILPASGFIAKERLDINPLTQKGVLRFPPAADPVAVYRNDRVIPSGDYTFDSSDYEVFIGSGWYVAQATYTASYEPKGTSDVTPSGVVVSFANDALMDAEETFIDNDTRQYRVELSHYPYMKYEIINDTSDADTASPGFIYVDGRWLNNTSVSRQEIDPAGHYDIFIVTVDGYDAENRTDYYDNENPALTSYDGVGYPNYEYLHSGKNLYFNTPLKNKEVKVDYCYLNDYIQLKTLLRNNSKSIVAQTPILEDYTLKLRTL